MLKTRRSVYLLSGLVGAVAPEQLRTLIRQYARPAKPSVGAAR
jgi:hypothetical protein